jgi:hypothetical protein
VGEQHELRGALLEQLVERRDRRPDPGVVGDLAGVVQGDVEVHPDDDDLAADLEVVEGPHRMRCAKSATRLE